MYPQGDARLTLKHCANWLRNFLLNNKSTHSDSIKTFSYANNSFFVVRKKSNPANSARFLATRFTQVYTHSFHHPSYTTKRKKEKINSHSYNAEVISTPIKASLLTLLSRALTEDVKKQSRPEYTEIVFSLNCPEENDSWAARY